MNSNVARPGTISHGVVLSFVGWFGSYAYLYLFTLGGPKPLYSYLALLCFTVLHLSMQRGRVGCWTNGLSLFIGWQAVYIVYAITSYFRSTQSPTALQAFISLGEAALLAISFAFLMAEPRRVRKVQTTLIFLVLFATTLNILDFLVPTFSKVPGRAAGFYINPNVSGLLISLAMVGGFVVVPRRLRLLYVLVCGTGVLVTFSRAAWIAWGLGVASLAWWSSWGSRRRRFAMIVVFIVIGAGLTSLLFLGRVGTLIAESPVQALLTPGTAARLGIGSAVLSGDATEERLEVLFYGLKAFSEEPWLGQGLGYTAEWGHTGPHNMYLLFGVEGGIPGIALYVALLAILWVASNGAGRVIVLQLVLSGAFSHNLLDQPAIVMMMAFVVADGAVALHTRFPKARRYNLVRA